MGSTYDEVCTYILNCEHGSSSGLTNMMLTVLSGVLVFILGQLFNEYFLKPIQEYKKLRAKISYCLVYYANMYMNPILNNKRSDEYDKGSEEIRKLASEVNAMIEIRPKGNIFIPKANVLSDVSSNLIGISNNFYSTHLNEDVEANRKRQENIYSKLNIKGYRNL